MSNLASLFDRYKALVIFDTETSGLNPGDDQIIELAALRVERTQAGALRIAGKMDTFIRLPEGERLPENIVTLTGITEDTGSPTACGNAPSPMPAGSSTSAGSAARRSTTTTTSTSSC